MKKFILLMLSLIMTLSIGSVAFAATHSMIGTYKSSAGNIMTVTAGSNLPAGVSPDDDLGDYNFNIQGKVYKDVSYGGAIQFGYDSEHDTLKKVTSTDGSIQFPSQQFVYGFVNSSGEMEVGLIGTESSDGKVLLEDADHNLYWAKRTSEDTTTIYYDVVEKFVFQGGTAAEQSTSTFKSDTGSKVTLAYGQTYQFKITSLNGKKPTFVVPGKSFQVSAKGSKGSDYYFVVKAIGKDGDGAGAYVNGQSTPSTVMTISNKVTVDTGSKLTVKAGKSYTFKVTASSRPVFTSGNGSVFRTIYTGQQSNHYFYKVTAVGKTGQTTGFYVNNSKMPCTVGTIA